MVKSILLTCGIALFSAAPAFADPWKDESGHGRYSRPYYYDCGPYGCPPAGHAPRYKYKSERKGYKYEWKSGDCKYEFKAGRKGYKEEYKCD